MRRVVVFDTNILISAVLSLQGSPFHCLALAKMGIVESVTCEDILHEFHEKLVTKFAFISPERASIAVEEVRLLSRVVTILHALQGGCADPDDDMVLECAVVGGATHIVTGDRRHLLPLTNYQGVAIVSATQFLALVATL